MAEDRDDSEKTEEPTQRRLDESRRKGQVASSREVNHWFMILGATVIALMFLPDLLRDTAGALFRFVERPHAIPAEGDALRDLIAGTLLSVGGALLLPAALLVAAAVAAALVQNGFMVSAEGLKPKLEKISPRAGFGRLFSLRSLSEFLKGILKLCIVGVVAAALLLPEFDRIELASGMDASQLLETMHGLAVRLLVGVLAVMTLIAVLDLLYQRYEHQKKLRMSRQDLKEEYKETEGDPIIKQRLRQIRLERSRRRMMAAVPEADVVITNPTHYAVALKYDADKMAAPRLIAKGADTLALRIREVAKANGVPVVENPPLARALHAGVELDQEIPAEHYRAVAEIIGYIWRLRKS